MNAYAHGAQERNTFHVSYFGSLKTHRRAFEVKENFKFVVLSFINIYQPRQYGSTDGQSSCYTLL